MFGFMTVAIVTGLRDLPDASGATLATVLPAFAVIFVAALIRHDPHGAWPFFLAGLLAPGISQILFTKSVQEIGASRVSVTVGAAPLAAVTIAILFLGEPIRLPLLLGAVAIVAGGAVLVMERGRPEHLRARGIAFAAATALLFATRDNVVRAMHGHAAPETAGAAILFAGVVVASLWTRRLPTKLELRKLAPAGLLFGVSYICLFEAYWRGRVTVVSPLVATESLFGVALAALLVRHTEGMGRRIAVGAVLVVIGGAIIGAAAG
jgi:drug/metabolite transporter (DMT)-like permease